MRVTKRRVIAVLFIIASFYFYGVAGTTLRQLKPYENLITLIQTRPTISANEANQMQQKNINLESTRIFSIWGQDGLTQIENSALNRTTEVKVIYVNGGTQTLFLENTNLLYGDLEGCLIDKITAERLFGSYDIVGMTIRYNGESYPIRGVLQNVEEVLVLPIKEQSEFKLDTMTLIKTSDESAKEIKKLAAMQFDFHGEILNFSLLSIIVKLFIIILPLMISIQLIMLLRHYMIESKKESREKIVWSVLLVIIVIGLGYLFVNMIRFPKDAIPTKWSDFAFWGALWKEQVKSALLLVQSAKRVPELQFLSLWARTFQCILVSMLCYWSMILLMKKEK